MVRPTRQNTLGKDRKPVLFFFWKVHGDSLIMRSQYEKNISYRNKLDFADANVFEELTMIKEIKGQVTAGKGKYAVVVSRFNEFISTRLLAGAIDCLQRHGAAEQQISVVWVPGACEIVQAAKKLAQSGTYVAVLCLGAVIRGQTSHYDYVCQQIARGIGQINYDSTVPVAFGVLTCDSLEQAVDRAGTKMGNAGADAALTAMEMADVLKQL
jgi:6,7-dimethyl-8-ribityllumazine synthase